MLNKSIENREMAKRQGTSITTAMFAVERLAPAAWELASIVESLRAEKSQPPSVSVWILELSG